MSMAKVVWDQALQAGLAAGPLGLRRLARLFRTPPPGVTPEMLIEARNELVPGPWVRVRFTETPPSWSHFVKFVEQRPDWEGSPRVEAYEIERENQATQREQDLRTALAPLGLGRSGAAALGAGRVWDAAHPAPEVPAGPWPVLEISVSEYAPEAWGIDADGDWFAICISDPVDYYHIENLEPADEASRAILAEAGRQRVADRAADQLLDRQQTPAERETQMRARQAAGEAAMRALLSSRR